MQLLNVLIKVKAFSCSSCCVSLLLFLSSCLDFVHSPLICPLLWWCVNTPQCKKIPECVAWNALQKWISPAYRTQLFPRAESSQSYNHVEQKNSNALCLIPVVLSSYRKCWEMEFSAWCWLLSLVACESWSLSRDLFLSCPHLEWD